MKRQASTCAFRRLAHLHENDCHASSVNNMEIDSRLTEYDYRLADAAAPLFKDAEFLLG